VNNSSYPEVEREGQRANYQHLFACLMLRSSGKPGGAKLRKAPPPQSRRRFIPKGFLIFWYFWIQIWRRFL